VLTLQEVEIGKSYVMLLTNYSGLRRYVIGDIIVFTNLHPRKIKITGRTKYFIDMIGERVFLEHIEKAVFETCKQTNAVIAEYTVGPLVYKDTTSIYR
jgi:phenylacetate-coenzyme A ligase PaaK-like adenylate-forming protein